MTSEKFNRIVENRMDICKRVLVHKACEYATARDRLSNFYQAAVLQHSTPQQALGGMLAKHTVALFDFLHEPEQADSAKWIEKITDSINYLFLLEAVLIEEGRLEDLSDR